VQCNHLRAGLCLLLGLDWNSKASSLLPARAKPNSLVQEERFDEAVDVVGALQLQRVPCVADDL